MRLRSAAPTNSLCGLIQSVFSNICNMPCIEVPLTRHDGRKSVTISIWYRVHGKGEVLVFMIPGLCVPASMYDSMSAVLRATGEFTTVMIDNRGMGRSEAPYAGLRGGAGYVISELAQDCWQVVDAVRQNRALGEKEDESLHAYAEIGIVGHSMGGMIAQHMICMRPTQVRFVALLSTHAGGLWNLLPSRRLMWAGVKVAWSGFDRDVHAAVNLSLHFTQKFLNDWVGHSSWKQVENNEHSGSKQVIKQQALSDTGCEENSSANKSASKVEISGVTYVDYAECRLLELGRDAQIYFGLTRSAVMEAVWKSHRNVFRTIAKEGRRVRRRFDVYHARYVGKDGGSEEKNESKMGSESLSNPEDSPHAMYGHLAVVRSYRLDTNFAGELRACSRIVKLVMMGRHDEVVTPGCSRRLATLIGANTVVEVDAKHFITDEAGAEVTMHIMYGLRKSFFAQSGCECLCDWCRDGGRK